MSDDRATRWQQRYDALEASLRAERDRRVEHRQMNQSLNEQVQALQRQLEQTLNERDAAHQELERRTAWSNEQIQTLEGANDKLRDRVGRAIELLDPRHPGAVVYAEPILKALRGE